MRDWVLMEHPHSMLCRQSRLAGAILPPFVSAISGAFGSVVRFDDGRVWHCYDLRLI